MFHKIHTLYSWLLEKTPEIKNLSLLDAEMANLIIQIRKDVTEKEYVYVPLTKIQPLHPINRDTSQEKVAKRMRVIQNNVDSKEEKLTREEISSLMPSITPIQAIQHDGIFYTFEGNGRLDALRKTLPGECEIEIEHFTLPQNSPILPKALSLRKKHQL